MNTTLLAIIGSALTLAIAIFKYFGSKINEQKKKIDEASKLIEDGVNERDSSKITAGFTRLHNDK